MASGTHLHQLRRLRQRTRMYEFSPTDARRRESQASVTHPNYLKIPHPPFSPRLTIRARLLLSCFLFLSLTAHVCVLLGLTCLSHFPCFSRVAIEPFPLLGPIRNPPLVYVCVGLGLKWASPSLTPIWALYKGRRTPPPPPPPKKKTQGTTFF